MKKKLDGNYTRMLRAILNKSWRQHLTRYQLYGHLAPITKTIQVKRTRHAGNCWRSKDELISDVFLWTPTYSQAKAGRPARTYIQQQCEDTGCNPKDQPEVMNEREKWRERAHYQLYIYITWRWIWESHNALFYFKMRKDQRITANSPGIVKETKNFRFLEDNRIKWNKLKSLENTLTLRERRKNWWSWMWCWYQYYLEHFERSPNTWKKLGNSEGIKAIQII